MRLNGHPSKAALAREVMKIFIYEFISGGGLWTQPLGRNTTSLLSEGQAMAAAVTADFAELADVCTTRDSRLQPFHDSRCRVAVIDEGSDELKVIRQLAAASDLTLLIAPETDGVLLERCLLVEAAGRLLSPGSNLVRLASDKHATAEHLTKFGVPVPQGIELLPGQLPPTNLFPAVLKPLDGCGSAGIRRLDAPNDLQIVRRKKPMRLERYIQGTPASVAVLSGPGGNFALPPCTQHLSDDGSFTYLGGVTPLLPELSQRAMTLALKAASALPKSRGYIGFDLVLGDDPLGRDDTVIEINPRLTTSYIGLRAHLRGNLAGAMLAVVEGCEPDLSVHPGRVQFSCTGEVRVLSSRQTAISV